MKTARFMTFTALVAAPLFASCHSDYKKRNEDLSNQVHQYEVDLNQAKAERDEARNREENLQRQLVAAKDEARIARDGSVQPAGVRTPEAEVVKANPGVAAEGSERKVASAEETRAIAKKLSGALASSKAVVETKDGHVRVVLPSSASFAAGSADLDAQGKKTVKEIARAILKDLPADARLTIVGHTDSDPVKKAKSKFADNKALSLARAREVMNELKSAGIGAKRMSAEGVGDSQPVAAGAGRTDKAKNRRVEIVIE